MIDEHIFLTRQNRNSCWSRRRVGYGHTLWWLLMQKSGGASVVFIAPQWVPIIYYFKLNFSCINNNVEYETLILAIRIIINIQQKKVKFIGDSLLIVNQVKGILNVKINYFKNIKIWHLI